MNFQLAEVLETHIHADHLSGSVRVARKYGSEVAISAFENYTTPQVSSEKDPKYNLISTGQKFELGDGFYLEALHTPGHTDGSMSFLLKIHNVIKNENIRKQESSADNFAENNDNDGNPDYYLFTGDTIFVNGVGRPDLRNKSQEGTNKLFHTYYNVIFGLPNKTIILPFTTALVLNMKNPFLIHWEQLNKNWHP